MHVGIDIGDRWMRAAQQVASQAPRAIPDLRDPKELATRLSLQVDTDGVLVGEIASELQREQPTAKVVTLLRQRLIQDGPVLEMGPERHWLAEGLVALCLRKVQRDVQGLGIGGWQSVTLTVPANASPAYCERLSSAARLADLPQFQLLEEPLAAWTFVNAPMVNRRPSLVIHFGEIASSVTVIDDAHTPPRMIASDSINEASRQQIEMAVATHIKQDLSWPQRAPVGMSHEILWQELINHVQNEYPQSLASLPEVSRRAWLIGGQICEFHLRKVVWQEAWSPIRTAVFDQVFRTVRQAGLSPKEIGQVILSGEPVSGTGIETELPTMFPQAQLWHRPDLAPWVHAYGAALMGPSHAAWRTERSSSVSSVPLTDDVGILIMNPATGQPDLDVLIPAGTRPPFRAVRRYQTQQAGQKQFFVEFARRQTQSPHYRSLSRWETPLSSVLEFPRVEVACEFHVDGNLEIILSGDLQTASEMRYDVRQDQAFNPRETCQRKLLETTPWRD